MYVIIAIGIAIITIALIIWKKHHQLKDHEILAKFFVDKNWSKNEEAELDQSVHHFKIDISDDDIKDLHHRLDITRFPTPSLSTSKFNYGVRDDSLKNLISYWRTEYDWKKQERLFNEFQHFKTNIEGLNVHFIYQKPVDYPPNVKLNAILLVHGWPGSFVEYLEVIKQFTDPKKFGASESDAFAVVCPSIPGHGFSDAPEKEGFNAYECARVFHKLMLRLGYKKYYVAGGDWGSLISTAIAMLYPSSVNGCYVTLCATAIMTTNFFQLILSYYFPKLYYSPEERNRIFPLKSFMASWLQESGYYVLQATKPDSIGFALSDSPAGIAAHIVDKFCAWTDDKGRNSNTGLLEKYWTQDQLLNNIMIYWWSGNITSSMRFYKENTTSELRKVAAVKVRVPSGFGWFPDELFTTCKFWLKGKYNKLIHFTRFKYGGHFNAYQCPTDFADDLRLFVRSVKKYEKKQADAEKMEMGNIRSSQLDRYEKKHE